MEPNNKYHQMNDLDIRVFFIFDPVDDLPSTPESILYYYYKLTVMLSTSHLHPMIVHFPIALIMAGFLAEVVSLFFRSEKCLSKTGFYLMVLGALAAIAAWGSGQLFTTEPTQGAIVDVFNKHETGAFITMIIIVLGAAFRIWLVTTGKEETPLKWIAFCFYLLAFAGVAFTGFMGGTMVYNFMMAL
jgi:uncharacterized membrane protein